MPHEYKRFSLSDLSAYRSDLMGYSILWIMMLHFRFVTIKPLGFLAQYGYAGVEIFIFVSGLGLFYSLEKDSRLLPFYAKRLRRIFPVYYLVGIAASLLLFHDDFPTYLLRYTTIGFWTGLPWFEWYVPSIVALYLAAPFIKRLVTPSRQYILLAVAVAIIVAAFFIARQQAMDRSHYFLFYRIPAFLLGMYVAMLIRQQSGPRTFYAIMALGIPVFALCFPMHKSIYEFKYYSVFFLLPLFMWLFCQLSKHLPLLSKPVRMIGNASLEVYLIQTLFFTAFNNGQLTVSHQWHDAVTLLLMAGCSLAGIALHSVIGRIKFLH